MKIGIVPYAEYSFYSSISFALCTVTFSPYPYTVTFNSSLYNVTFNLSNLIRPRCAERAKPGRGKPVLIMHIGFFACLPLTG